MRSPPHHLLVVLLLAAAGAAQPALADIFTWMDEGGVRHFSDQPPPQHLAEPATDAAPPPALPVQVRPASLFERTIRTGSGRVTIYTGGDCAACETAKQYFRDHVISYTEHDIDTSPTARNEVDIMQAAGLPVILVRDRRMDGFQARVFARIWAG